MKKLIQNIKNLFQIYYLLTRGAITFDLKKMGVEQGRWYCLNALVKRENDKILVDEILLFGLKNRKQAKEKSRQLKSYYKSKD